MFIIEPNPNKEMQLILKRVKRMVGVVPPHFELYATVHPTRFKMFLEEIMYLTSHKTINPDFFAFLRYYLAFKNHFTYCYNFNETLLLTKGYTKEALKTLENSPTSLPLDERHQELFLATLSAIDEPTNFTKESIEKLKNSGWSDADIFDAIDHGAFLFKFSKVLKAYSKAS